MDFPRKLKSNLEMAWVVLLAMSVMPAFGETGTDSALPPEASTADCASCAKESEKIARYRAMEKSAAELLGKNRDYLINIGAGQASKFLKVKSNIVQILRKLDQLKSQAGIAEVEFVRRGCLLCEEKRSHDQTAT